MRNRTPPQPVFFSLGEAAQVGLRGDLAALFMALTLSGPRVWNAPPSPARTQALTLWGLVQALNAAWMAIGPRHLGGQLATSVASSGTSAAYASRSTLRRPT